MATDFDPDYTWLGIPPADQPPHPYRLLDPIAALSTLRPSPHSRLFPARLASLPASTAAQDVTP